MKTLLLAAMVLAIGTERAEAKCGCGADLLTTSVAEGQPRIVVAASCAQKAPTITLEDAAGKSVAIAVTATHDGYSRSAQFVVEPRRTLLPGTYKVLVDGRYDPLPLTVVAATKNASLPAWSSAPSVTDQKQMEFGCGPAKTVKVSAGTASLAYVELVDVSSKQQTAGYVRVENGELAIGHGMCGGAFELMKGRSYTAAITLLAPERGTSSMSRTVSFTYAP
ncbi:MAG: hypothetical protein H0V17_25465 [Deltaproteobacteria bacterium]|nr:hypothetical protein [Deltaproteobacteria bacterium]